MELRHLRYFRAVAEELHFGRAAKRLHISQPPLSMQIQNLESELGVQLLQRSKRQVRLTRLGELFLQRIKVILTDVERAVEEIQAADRGELDTVVLGYKSAIMLEEIAPLIRRFHQSFPNVKMKLVQGSTGEQFEHVMDHRFDVGFVDAPVDSCGDADSLSPLRGVPVMVEQLVMAVPAGHPLAKRKQVRLEEFKNEVFAFPDRQSVPSVYDLWIGMCQQAGFSPNIRHTAQSMPEVLTFVAAGAGVSLAPKSISGHWVDQISFLPLKETMQVTISAIFRPDNESKAVQTFCEVIEQWEV
jgi:DNA-binding transcriptional LysR family regulator